MNDMNKDDGPRPTTPGGPQRSGSDTASAANISAGTSVGNAGQPATPYGQQGRAGSSTGGAGQSGASPGQPGGMGSSAGGAGQSGTSYGQPGGAGSSTGGAGRSGTSYGQPGGTGSSGQGSGSSDWASSAARDATRNSGGMREQSGGTLDQASEWTREQYRQGARQLYQARNNSMSQLRSAGGNIERFATENPLLVGVMGLAAGLVIGALLPRTRQEDSAFGRWADEVREQGMRYARDATQRGRQYMEEALGSGESDDDWHPEEESRGNIRSSGPRYQNH